MKKSDAACFQISRRLVCTFGISASLSAALAASKVFAAPTGPPGFFTKQGQFTFLEPQADVSQIKLRSFDGRERTLGSYRGKALLISFWASWCPPCRRELPIFERLQAMSRSEPFAILPVALDRDPSTAARFIDHLNLKQFRTFIDPHGVVASGPESHEPTPFPLYGMPMAYLVDKNGLNVGYLSGEADWSSPSGLELLRYYGRA